MILLAAMCAFSAGPALAQTAATTGGIAQTKSSTTDGGERPIDKGPNTPGANSVYQGGGMVLQGAPGAPAPQPQPTQPGETPRNLVPK